MSSNIGGIIEGIYPDARLISIERFSKGVINKTYSVEVDGKELVLRVYPRELWKVKKESYLYNFIRKKTDVPVPKVIKAGRNYLLIEKVNGKELDIRDKSLVSKSGELLAKIHSIKFPYSGWIIGKDIKPRFERWPDFIEYDLKLKLSKIPSSLKSLKGRIRKIVDKNNGLLDIRIKPCLLHKDYHSSHIITNKGKINGIIDWEWAMAGHNEFDLAKSCVWMFPSNPNLEKIFIGGYERYGSISDEFFERKRLYRLLVLTSALSFSHECKNMKWCRYNLEQVKGAINEYYKDNREIH